MWVSLSMLRSFTNNHSHSSLSLLDLISYISLSVYQLEGVELEYGLVPSLCSDLAPVPRPIPSFQCYTLFMCKIDKLGERAWG